MPLKITNKDDYILFEFSTGMDFWEIMEGIGKMFSMPDFKYKNDIWSFRAGEIKVGFNDLKQIKDLAAEYYPEDSKGTKSAIVAETGLQHSLAIMFSEIGKDLPREIRVFSDLESAEDWITT